MKSMNKIAIAVALAVSLAACGERVEVPPAHLGKIMTKDGYLPGTVGTSKFRLPACWSYCDKLVDWKSSRTKPTEPQPEKE